MGWLCYEWECLRGAFRGKLGIADGIVGFLTYLFSPLGLVYPDPEAWGRAMSWLPSAALLTVLLCLVFVGVSRSSFKAHEKLKSEVARLRSFLVPKIKCSFDEDTPGCVSATSFSGTQTKVTYYRVKLDANIVGAIPNCSGSITSIDLDGEPVWNSDSIALPIAPGERENPTTKDLKDKVPEYLDVFYITEHNEVSIVWPHGVKPNSFSDGFFWTNGKYVFHIMVSAPSTISVPIDVILDWSGDWKTASVSSGH